MSDQIRSAMNDTHCSAEKWEKIFHKKKPKKEQSEGTKELSINDAKSIICFNVGNESNEQ